MNSLAKSILLISILTMSGCFSSPTNEEEQEEKMQVLWQYAYDFDGGAPRATPLIYENNIITSGDAKITALDFQTGEIRWKTPYDFNIPLMNDSFGVVNNIIAGSIPDKILSWDLRTGDFLWEVEIDDSLNLGQFKGITGTSNSFIAASSSAILEISESGELFIHNQEARTFETTFSEGVLYAGQRKGDPGVGVFSAYDLNTMQLLWRFEPGEFRAGTRVPPIKEGTKLYVGTTGGPNAYETGFFALNAQTGEEIWRQEGIFTYSAVLEGDYIYVNDVGGIYKLRKSDGDIEWHCDFSGVGTGPIAYGYGYIYSNHSGTIYILDAETGEIVHKFGPPEGSYFWEVTVEKGRIFAQSNRHLYAFAPWGYEEPLEE